MGEYTKGDWKQTTSGLATLVISEGEIRTGEITSSKICILCDQDTDEEMDANAHLIAAAPIGDELTEAVLNNAGSVKIKEIARRFRAKADGES